MARLEMLPYNNRLLLLSIDDVTVVDAFAVLVN